MQVLIDMVFALLQNEGREANFFTSPQLKVDEDKESIGKTRTSLMCEEKLLLENTCLKFYSPTLLI